MVLGSHCAWFTLQDSGPASLERDMVSLQPPPLNALLSNREAVSVGKALVEVLRGSSEPVEGQGSTAQGHLGGRLVPFGSIQPWAGPLGLAGAVQWVGVHTMAADRGALSRAGSSRKGGPFGLVQPCWHPGLAGVSGYGHVGGISGRRALGLPVLVGGRV